MMSTFDAGKPINFCIYCRRNASELGRNEKLTDEHIFPDGLSGQYILYAASCTQCAMLTSYSERRVLKEQLGIVREKYSIYGKRKKNKRPTSLQMTFQHYRSWNLEHVHVPVSEYPLLFRMPRFPAPRYLTPAQAHDADFVIKHDYRRFDDVETQGTIQRLLEADPRRERVEVYSNVFELSKVLAKIAYGCAIYFLGPYAVRPYTCDLIVAPKALAPHFLRYVGGAFLGGAPVTSVGTGKMCTCTLRFEPYEDATIIVARLHLLAPFGTPVYEAVVGELIQIDRLTPVLDVQSGIAAATTETWLKSRGVTEMNEAKARAPAITSFTRSNVIVPYSELVPSQVFTLETD